MPCFCLRWDMDLQELREWEKRWNCREFIHRYGYGCCNVIGCEWFLLFDQLVEEQKQLENLFWRHFIKHFRSKNQIPIHLSKIPHPSYLFTQTTCRSSRNSNPIQRNTKNAEKTSLNQIPTIPSRRTKKSVRSLSDRLVAIPTGLEPAKNDPPQPPDRDLLNR